jgi:hypothetical protein
MTAQWQGLLQNLGIWQGSFTQLSAAGEVQDDVPSELTLSLSEDEKTVYLLLKRANTQDVTLQFNYPGPGYQIPFFENGCFSQASLQHAPWTQFGAEFSLFDGQDRRLRLVQLYRQGTDLSSLTLIREQRAGSMARESPPLKVDALLGQWQGEAVTLYADYRSPEVVSTHLSIQQSGDRLQQTLQFGSQQIQSSAQISGNCLLFTDSPQPMQLLCLPGGASALCPSQIQPRTPFVLEIGWLMEPTQRQRMIRSYGAGGEWASITLVTERKL